MNIVQSRKYPDMYLITFRSKAFIGSGVYEAEFCTPGTIKILLRDSSLEENYVPAGYLELFYRQVNYHWVPLIPNGRLL